MRTTLNSPCSGKTNGRTYQARIRTEYAASAACSTIPDLSTRAISVSFYFIALAFDADSHWVLLTKPALSKNVLFTSGQCLPRR
jgi:hypothetical protein